MSRRPQHLDGEIIAFRPIAQPAPGDIDRALIEIDEALAGSIRPINLMRQFAAWRTITGLSPQVEAARAEVDFYEFLEVFDLLPVEASNGQPLSESDYCEALASMWRSVSKQIGRYYAKRTRPTRDRLVLRLRDKLQGDNRVQWIDFAQPIGGRQAQAARQQEARAA